jgi:hypothetical protein
VLPGSSIEAACIRAERIRVSFAENCRFVMRHQGNAMVSAGASVSGGVEQTLDELIEASDMALYAAKAEGRNRIRRADRPKPAPPVSFGSWLCKSAATRNGDGINHAPSRHVIHENSRVCPISIGPGKILLVASQFLSFYTD